MEVQRFGIRVSEQSGCVQKEGKTALEGFQSGRGHIGGVQRLDVEFTLEVCGVLESCAEAMSEDFVVAEVI